MYAQFEMWKLVFIRANLKVLITYYDRDEEYTARTFSRRIQEVNAAGVDTEDDEYLVIVAPRTLEDSAKPIPWSYWRLEQHGKYRKLQMSASGM
jgi:hypothetical protein